MYNTRYEKVKQNNSYFRGVIALPAMIVTPLMLTSCSDSETAPDTFYFNSSADNTMYNHTFSTKFNVSSLAEVESIITSTEYPLDCLKWDFINSCCWNLSSSGAWTAVINQFERNPDDPSELMIDVTFTDSDGNTANYYTGTLAGDKEYKQIYSFSGSASSLVSWHIDFNTGFWYSWEGGLSFYFNWS